MLNKGDLYTEHMAGWNRQFTVKEVLYSNKTDKAKIDILDLEYMGRTLFIDGQRQSSEADERCYHEALVHPAVHRIQDPERTLSALVLGGGEGAVCRELLKYENIGHIDWVDYDMELVSLCLDLLPQHSEGINHRIGKDITLIESDVLKFADDTLIGSGGNYDIIIYDMPEWTPGSTEHLFDFDVLYAVSLLGVPSSVMSAQLGPLHPAKVNLIRPIVEIWKNIFKYPLFVPLPETQWLFGVATGDTAKYNPKVKDYMTKELFWATEDSLKGVRTLPAYLIGQ